MHTWYAEENAGINPTDRLMLTSLFYLLLIYRQDILDFLWIEATLLNQLLTHSFKRETKSHYKNIEWHALTH